MCLHYGPFNGTHTHTQYGVMWCGVGSRDSHVHTSSIYSYPRTHSIHKQQQAFVSNCVIILNYPLGEFACRRITQWPFSDCSYYHAFVCMPKFQLTCKTCSFSWATETGTWIGELILMYLITFQYYVLDYFNVKHKHKHNAAFVHFFLFVCLFILVVLIISCS